MRTKKCKSVGNRSRNWVKEKHACDGWRIFDELLFARISVLKWHSCSLNLSGSNGILCWKTCFSRYWHIAAIYSVNNLTYCWRHIVLEIGIHKTLVRCEKRTCDYENWDTWSHACLEILGVLINPRLPVLRDALENTVDLEFENSELCKVWAFFCRFQIFL